MSTSVSSSAIRDILAIAQRPGIVSLAGGVPDTRLLDTHALAEAARIGFTDPAKLSYLPSEGEPALVAALAALMRDLGAHEADAESLLVTTGSQQGLDLLVRAIVAPGDTVLLERPCYPAILNLLAEAGANVIDVLCDADGPLPGSIAALQATTRAKLLYVGPTFQNPTGRCMPWARRAAIATLASDQDLYVLEDDPYRELWYATPPPPPIVALCPDRVCYAGSLSKSLAPGLRVGWLHVPPSLRDRVLHLKQGADLNTATPIQHVVASYLGSGQYERHLTTVRPRYRERRDAVHAALRLAWPRETTFDVPSGGFYFWVGVAGVSWSKLLPLALEERIAYVPGAAFCVDGRLDGHLRLAFGSEDPERLHPAVVTLGQLAVEALAQCA